MAKMHAFTRHMASHVCDTWKTMCQLAWNVQFSINRRKSIWVKGSQEEKKERKEREKGKKEKGNKEKK